MSKIIIYSTLTQSHKYTKWGSGGAELKIPLASVTVKGGANLADKHLITPRGVATEVTAEELEILEENRVFQLHVKNGFIKVDRGTRTDVEKAVSDMVGRDMSAPLVPQDYILDGKKPPVTNAEIKVEAKSTGYQKKSTGRS